MDSLALNLTWGSVNNKILLLHLQGSQSNVHPFKTGGKNDNSTCYRKLFFVAKLTQLLAVAFYLTDNCSFDLSPRSSDCCGHHSWLFLCSLRQCLCLCLTLSPRKQLACSMPTWATEWIRNIAWSHCYAV